MKPFYTAADFNGMVPSKELDYIFTVNKKEAELIANLANAKLEREGKVVYVSLEHGKHWSHGGALEDMKYAETHKVLLINPEELKEK